jgi:uncharacterized membrane protein affecting hemolysin expression
MSQHEQNLVVVMAVVAVIALGLAVGAGVFAFSRSHHDRARIRQLEAQVHTLCQRQTVTGIAQARSGKITATTEKGC